MQYFDVKEWLRLHLKLSKHDLSFQNANNSFDFLLIWSVFESRFLVDSFKNNKNYNDQLIQLSKKIPVDKLNVDEIYGFLHKRYFVKGKPTQFFGNLNLTNNLQKNLKEIALTTEPSQYQKLQFVLLIIYRFRCNLFHGRKDPLLWKNFDKVFFFINKFLAEVLDVCSINKKTANKKDEK